MRLFLTFWNCLGDEKNGKSQNPGIDTEKNTRAAVQNSEATMAQDAAAADGVTGYLANARAEALSSLGAAAEDDGDGVPQGKMLEDFEKLLAKLKPMREQAK